VIAAGFLAVSDFEWAGMALSIMGKLEIQTKIPEIQTKTFFCLDFRDFCLST
jgi:hypothetical protein